MDITWHGNTCFTIKNENTRLVIDPDKEAGKRKGEVVLSSLGENTEAVEGSEKVFDWPGEYEIKNIPILAFQAWTESKPKKELKEDAEEGEEIEVKQNGEKTIIFYFKIGKIKICHLGNLGHTLTSEVMKQLENVDILMINAGEGSNLGIKKAMEIVESIDPRVLIPMGSGAHADFLKELGAENIEAQEKFTVKKRSELPDDSRQYIVLQKV